MMFEYGICDDCERERTSAGWCPICNIQDFKRNFSFWTSGNSMLDSFIRQTQISATQCMDFFEWIDFDQLDGVRNLGYRGAFSSIYSATWMEGPKSYFDENDQSWSRGGPTGVVLKRIDGFQEVTKEFIDHLLKYHKLLQDGSLAEYYGITKDPTSCYMIVMKHYNDADLYNYIEKSFGFLCWRDIADILWSISIGIDSIHKLNILHGNLHGGNILLDITSESADAKIADVGLNRFASKKNFPQSIYGVIPFVAPEIFLGKKPTKKSDIYSFGVIMWMLSSGVRPYHKRSHDYSLVQEIIGGLRPDHVEDTPPLYLKLLKRCLCADPKLRPTAQELNDTFQEWVQAICDNPFPSEISTQFDQAEDTRFQKFLKLEPTAPDIHRDAIYFSRPLDSIIAGS